MKGYFNTREGGSHQLGLLYAVKATTKPILELGAGESSTVQIHDIAKSNILTIEGHSQWLAKYLYLQSEKHKFLLLSEPAMIEFFKLDVIEWGVVLVDCQGGPWIGRQAAIKKYKDVSDYVVVHDTEYSAVQGYFGKVVDGKRDFSDTFKYWIEYQPIGLTDVPASVLASNKININNIQIEGITVLNRSK